MTSIRLALFAAALPLAAHAQSGTLQELGGDLVTTKAAPATIYVAKSFITMDPKQPRAEAVAVRDGRFAGVGSLAALQAANPGAALDRSFADKTVVAGFVEQHVHPVLAALTMNTHVISIEDWDAIDGFSPAVRDEAGYRKRLTEELAAWRKTNPDAKSPFISWGYHHYFHGPMSRQILDKLEPTLPVMIWHRSGHEMFLNTPALKLLGIDGAAVAALPPSAKAQLDLDKGHFFEQGMLSLIGKFAPYMATPEKFRAGLEYTVKYYHQNGITLACEPGGLPNKPIQDAINAVYSGNDVPFNHCFMADGKTYIAKYPNDPAAWLREADASDHWGSGRTWYLPKTVKLFTDGAIYSQLMQMKDGYTDGHHGAWIVEPAPFTAGFNAYWDGGYQIHVHTNGDASGELLVSTLEKAMARNPRKDHRTVWVHFGFATPELTRRWIAAGGIVSTNPYYVTALAGKYAKVGIGPERAANMAASGWVLKNGGSLSFHSDMPMAPAKPMALVWAGVTRQTAEGPVAGPDQRIGLDAALKAVTLDAAYSIRQENRAGSIEVGKDANLTVLEQDPYQVAPEKLKDVKVWGTMLEGRVFPVGIATRTAMAAPPVPARDVEAKLLDLIGY